jgi:hypothetical protein
MGSGGATPGAVKRWSGLRYSVSSANSSSLQFSLVWAAARGPFVTASPTAIFFDGSQPWIAVYPFSVRLPTSTHTSAARRVLGRHRLADDLFHSLPRLAETGAARGGADLRSGAGLARVGGRGGRECHDGGSHAGGERHAS